VESPQELYRRLATKFVADFIGMTDLLKGEVKKIQVNRLSVSAYDTLIELRAEDRFEIGEEVTIVTRPEMLKFSKGGPSSLRGTVRNVFFFGSLARYEIQVGKKELITLDDSNPPNLMAKGSSVHMEIIPDSVHVQKVE